MDVMDGASEQFKIKIGDFGLAKLENQPRTPTVEHNENKMWSVVSWESEWLFDFSGYLASICFHFGLLIADFSSFSRTPYHPQFPYYSK